MTKTDWENKSLVVIIAVCYGGNLLLGWAGYWVCEPGSVAQMLLYQVGNAFAISGAVMAARYTGLRGQQVTASGYILLGITHGISLAALGRSSINVERGMTMVMPMIPALIFMFWCELYPKWLRIAGMIPVILFVLVYINVHLGGSYFGGLLTAGYAGLQVLEMVWAVYLWKDWQQRRS
jgi:hypothetical protein